MIIRVGVKFIEIMFSLKNDYDSLLHHRPAHARTIMTEATRLLGLFLLSKDPAGKHHPLFEIPQAFHMRLLFLVCTCKSKLVTLMALPVDCTQQMSCKVMGQLLAFITT